MKTILKLIEFQDGTETVYFVEKNGIEISGSRTHDVNKSMSLIRYLEKKLSFSHRKELLTIEITNYGNNS